jgi:hypothetical protein
MDLTGSSFGQLWNKSVWISCCRFTSMQSTVPELGTDSEVIWWVSWILLWRLCGVHALKSLANVFSDMVSEYDPSYCYGFRLTGVCSGKESSSSGVELLPRVRGHCGAYVYFESVLAQVLFCSVSFTWFGCSQHRQQLRIYRIASPSCFTSTNSSGKAFLFQLRAFLTHVRICSLWFQRPKFRFVSWVH